MKRNTVVFLEVFFFGVLFEQVWGNWAKILRTPKNLPAPTPMKTDVLFAVLNLNIIIKKSAIKMHVLWMML